LPIFIAGQKGKKESFVLFSKVSSPSFSSLHEIGKGRGEGKKEKGRNLWPGRFESFHNVIGDLLRYDIKGEGGKRGERGGRGEKCPPLADGSTFFGSRSKKREGGRAQYRDISTVPSRDEGEEEMRVAPVRN